MTRVRRLLWLVVLVLFVCPSWIAPTMAMERPAHPTGDCHESLPPCPEPPCQDKGSARHAAGLCCPLMSLATAVLPCAAALDASRVPAGMVMTAEPHLTGLSPHKDPPPPRV